MALERFFANINYCVLKKILKYILDAKIATAR